MISLVSLKDKKALKKHALKLLASDDLEGLHILIYTLKDTNFKLKSSSRHIMVNKAIEKGYLEIFKHLLNMQFTAPQTLNHLFYQACATSSLEIADYIYQMEVVTKGTLNTCLVQASSRLKSLSEAKPTIEFLLNRGADIGSQHNFALRKAAEDGNIEMIDYYLSAGAAFSGVTDALIKASFSGKIEAVKHIIKLGESYFREHPDRLSYCAAVASKEVSGYIKEVLKNDFSDQ